MPPKHITSAPHKGRQFNGLQRIPVDSVTCKNGSFVEPLLTLDRLPLSYRLY